MTLCVSLSMHNHFFRMLIDFCHQTFQAKVSLSSWRCQTILSNLFNRQRVSSLFTLTDRHNLLLHCEEPVDQNVVLSEIEWLFFIDWLVSTTSLFSYVALWWDFLRKQWLVWADNEATRCWFEVRIDIGKDFCGWLLQYRELDCCDEMGRDIGITIKRPLWNRPNSLAVYMA